MRRVTSALLLGCLGTALLAGCQSSGTSTGADQQTSYIEQVGDEQQGLAHGELRASVPTDPVQGGTGTMEITISGTAADVPPVSPAAPGTGATASAVATSVLVGGMMAPQVSCEGIGCSAVSDNPQPVGGAMSGQWTWTLSYGQSGTATVRVVAVLFQTDTSNVLWQSAPLTLTLHVGATAQQRVDRSLGWLHDTIISVAAVVAALAPGVAALLRWRSKRRKRATSGPAAAGPPHPGKKAEAPGAVGAAEALGAVEASGSAETPHAPDRPDDEAEKV